MPFDPHPARQGVHPQVTLVGPARPVTSLCLALLLILTPLACDSPVAPSLDKKEPAVTASPPPRSEPLGDEATSTASRPPHGSSAVTKTVARTLNSLRNGARTGLLVPHDGSRLDGPPELQFAVITDLHVRQSSQRGDPIPRGLYRLVDALVLARPDFVVVTGDLTSGDRDLHFSPRTMDRWWTSARTALTPLREANIPVLIIPGNHDAYTEEQQQAYRRAWVDLPLWLASLEIREDPLDDPPFYYSVDVGDLTLVLLNVVSRSLAEEQTWWLDHLVMMQDDAPFIAFGHLPLRSVVGDELTNSHLEGNLGRRLVKGNVLAYFCGHEHLLWDEWIELVRGGRIRQIISGVGGAGYLRSYGPSARRYCLADHCRLPASSTVVEVNPGTSRLTQNVTFVWAEVRHGELTVRPQFVDARGAHPYPQGQVEEQ